MLEYILDCDGYELEYNVAGNYDLLIGLEQTPKNIIVQYGLVQGVAVLILVQILLYLLIRLMMTI
jgi:hypothetical protein